MTYTIAYTDPTSDGLSLLLATVPDGQDVDGKARELIASQRLGHEDPETGEWIEVTYDTESGLVLTDDEPDDEDRIVWRGNDCGWLINERGETFDYAVRAG